MRKRYLIFILVIVLISSCTKRSYIPEEVYYSVDFGDSPKVVAEPKPEKETQIKPKPVGRQNDADIISSVVEYAKTFIGVPYKYGGTTPSGFDCSGFIMYVFKNFNIDLPRNAVDMSKVTDKVDIKNIKPGDLVFFKGSNIKSNDIGHVALVTEKTKDSFRMIHASSSKGVIINDFDQYEYWKSRYLFASRIKDEVLANTR